MSKPESGKKAEIDTGDRLLTLANELGFKEPLDLSKYREALKSAKHFGDFVAGLREYQKSAEVVVDHLDNATRPKGQIALILTSASIYYSRNMFSDSREALEDAILYAVNMDYREVENKITDILSADPRYTNSGL